MTTEENTKHIKSVSSGGESATFDEEARKASQRANDNDSLKNQVNRRVRPYFLGARMNGLPGW